jgi:hypothetical protein
MAEATASPVDQGCDLGFPPGGLEVEADGPAQVLFGGQAGDGRQQMELFVDLTRHARRL